MNKTFKPYRREQQFLLPPSLQEWLPEGHVAYFIIEVRSAAQDARVEVHWTTQPEA